MNTQYAHELRLKVFPKDTSPNDFLASSYKLRLKPFYKHFPAAIALLHSQIICIFISSFVSTAEIFFQVLHLYFPVADKILNSAYCMFWMWAITALQKQYLLLTSLAQFAGQWLFLTVPFYHFCCPQWLTSDRQCWEHGSGCLAQQLLLALFSDKSNSGCS